MTLVNLSPDCRDGKHAICNGIAWSLLADAPVECECDHASHADPDG